MQADRRFVKKIDQIFLLRQRLISRASFIRCTLSGGGKIKRNHERNSFMETAFKEFIGAFRADDFMWKAFHKSTKLFSTDFMLDELMQEAFYVGAACGRVSRRNPSRFPCSFRYVSTG